MYSWCIANDGTKMVDLCTQSEARCVSTKLTTFTSTLQEQWQCFYYIQSSRKLQPMKYFEGREYTSATCVINFKALDKVWFTGLNRNRRTVMEIGYGSGLLFIYDYEFGERLNISCQSSPEYEIVEIIIFYQDQMKNLTEYSIQEPFVTVANDSLHETQLTCRANTTQPPSIYKIQLNLISRTPVISKTTRLPTSPSTRSTTRPPSTTKAPGAPGQVQLVSPKQPVLREGDKFEAMCIVPDGRPAANITWYLDENQLLENIDQPILTPPTSDDLQTISQNMTRVLSADDDGKILVCRAEHAAYKTPSEAKRELSVQYPPKRLEAGPITIFGVKLLAEVRLNVTVRANPPPGAEWIFEEQWLVAPQSSDDGNVTALEPIHLGGGYYNLSLVLTRVRKEDVNRVYYVRARNDLGHEQFTVRISTMDEPAGGHSYPESFFYRNAKILIICAGAVVAILFLVFACIINHKLCVAKSAWTTVTLPFVLLGRIIRRKRTDATAVLPEKWTKVVSVEMQTKDASMMPIVSIKRVKDTASGLTSEYIYPADKKWELTRQNLSFGDVLGVGEFGRVLKAEYIGTEDSRMPNIVAVKMLKDNHTDADITALVSEMEIMKTVGRHKNVVNLLGCCSQDGPLYVVVEYASNGCLREFLIKHDPKRSLEGVSQLKERNLIQFALQVAKGMEFLVSRGCIHRDLAARNVLVSEDLTLKIADFGLARDVGNDAYYRKKTAGKLPVRWMAPESLEYNYYTEHSDIWSFGILFWEIMTFGCTPYRKLAA